MSALTDPIGGMLTTLVEAQRGMSLAETERFLQTGELPDLSRPPVEIDVEVDEVTEDDELSARTFLAGLSAISSDDGVLVAAARWKPQDHPRDRNGRFIEKGAVSNLLSAKKPAVADLQSAVSELDQSQWNRLTATQQEHIAERVTRIPETSQLGSELRAKLDSLGAPKTGAPSKTSSVTTPPLAGRAVFDAVSANRRYRYDEGKDDWSVEAEVIPADVLEALDSYAGPGYKRINSELRQRTGDDTKLTKATRQDVAGLEKAFTGSELTQDVIVVRGVKKGATVFGDAWESDMSGVEWTEHGFVSTSANPTVAKNFSGLAGSALLNITVPAGTRAIALSDFDDEAELLLERGTKMRVTADRGVVDGRRQLDVEVVRDGGVAQVSEDDEAGAPDADAGAPGDGLPGGSDGSGEAGSTGSFEAVGPTQLPEPTTRSPTAEWPFSYEEEHSVQENFGDLAQPSDEQYAASPDTYHLVKLPISALVPTQAPDDDEWGDAEDVGMTGRPFAVDIGGNLYLIDGHHRAKKAGPYGSMDVWVRQVKQDKRQPVTPPVATATTQLPEAVESPEDVASPVVTATKKAVPAVIYKKHADGAVVATSANGDRRMRWDAGEKKFIVERRQGDGWRRSAVLTKTAAYADVKKPNRWFVPQSDVTPNQATLTTIELPAELADPLAAVQVDTREGSAVMPPQPVEEVATSVPPVSRRRAGRDLSSTLGLDPTELTGYEFVLKSMKRKLGGDKQLSGITEMQEGWNDPARVVSENELTAAVNSGWTELYRGINHVFNGTSTEAAEQSRTGEWRMGLGIYGNGVYLSPRRSTADAYAGRQPERDLDLDANWDPNTHEWIGPTTESVGTVMRMAIDPEARIVNYDELVAERLEWMTQLKQRGEGVHPMWNDLGKYAAMRGYDGIKISGPNFNDGALYPPGVTNADQYVIFNRSVLMMDEVNR